MILAAASERTIEKKPFKDRGSIKKGIQQAKMVARLSVHTGGYVSAMHNIAFDFVDTFQSKIHSK